MTKKTNAFFDDMVQGLAEMNEIVNGTADPTTYRVHCGYPAKFHRNEGVFTVTFRDVPEAITQGDTLVQAHARAVDALQTALSFYVDDHKPLPKASPVQRGERLVEFSQREFTEWLRSRKRH